MRKPLLTIAVLRRRADLTQTELGALVSLSQGEISLLETGSLSEKQLETFDRYKAVQEGLKQVFGETVSRLLLPYEEYITLTPPVSDPLEKGQDE